jgi:hypothetical protein
VPVNTLFAQPRVNQLGEACQFVCEHSSSSAQLNAIGRIWEFKRRTPCSAVARWTVDNEYHVQDMLWVVLAPQFPDLDDEEWLKSLGHHHPRADLAIPSHRVIIEVKFARQDGKSFSGLI